MGSTVTRGTSEHTGPCHGFENGLCAWPHVATDCVAPFGFYVSSALRALFVGALSSFGVGNCFQELLASSGCSPPESLS